MKQFFDFLPLIIFFIVYKMSPKNLDIVGHSVTLGGIYSATFLLIASTIIIYGAQFLRQKKLEKSQLITLIAVIIFGGLTLSFHSDTFIKWKAPVINWVFGLAFLFSSIFGKKTLVERMLGSVIILSDALWKRLNTSWAIFFILLGTANLYVAFHFEKYWVDFKVFGSLILTIVFIVGQFIVLGKNMKAVEKTKE